ncbi:hypothetical protein QYE76_049168 [Lolium multiflorum]|uniref:Jacalin-type lectin domain-containing protein n=1 Tax=Lolium multiflorum TaxID=4521 RepID=A0AAD8SNQ1_LOLMU|nr:hypothetical protein QYE76_049168 [Lolium multiflorum]
MVPPEDMFQNSRLQQHCKSGYEDGPMWRRWRRSVGSTVSWSWHGIMVDAMLVLCEHDDGLPQIKLWGCPQASSCSERTLGPYGTEEGAPFELPAAGGRIIGFHGRSGTFLDALGTYVKMDA